MSKDNLTVLAVETATKACSAALIHNGDEFLRFEELPQKHAHRILPMIDELLKEAGISGKEVDILAFGEGPGAFTGVRIASGVIQGLALGWNKPVIAVSSLQAIAEGVLSSQTDKLESDINWMVLLDARMNEVYLLSGLWNYDSKSIEVGETLLISPEKAETIIKNTIEESITPVLGAGDIAEEYPQLSALFNDWSEILPSALSVARIGMKEHDKASKIEETLPTPVYLRNQVADTIEERKLKRKAQQK